jgi:hypothetical protein
MINLHASAHTVELLLGHEAAVPDQRLVLATSAQVLRLAATADTGVVILSHPLATEGLPHAPVALNDEEVIQDVLVGDDLVLLIEDLPLRISLVEKCLLLHVLGLFNILHVQASEVLLHQEGRQETDQGEAEPEDETIHVVDVLWGVIHNGGGQFDDT